ncbi:peptide MFS transporter [Cognatilysobacter terrigena]|uniref:peptide MFS transporter n=1 Tax=Cognatilysobacter terrigena TaxID=2488749 RepID=UPI001FE2B32B|nr:oligopeptide:H+ symporter [Lysobacter terrigena]
MTPASNAAALAADPRRDLFGHPKGVYVCFFTEMWERFSFYGMKALLLLFLLKHHLFKDASGYDVLGAYGGLVYCIPVFGGMLADRYLGTRKAVIFGGILLVLGHMGMTIEGHDAHVIGGEVVRDESALRAFYLSLALIIMGVGFLKPNISTIVGRLYAEDDPRRDSGFSLFYAGINLGALFASIVCGYLGQTLGWKYGFGAAGIGMALGLGQFLWGQKYLEGHAEPPRPELLRERVWGMPRELAIYVGAIVGLFPVAWLMWAVANGAFALPGDISLALGLMILVMVGVLAWFFWFTATRCTPVERQQMYALILLIAMCLVFFTLYEQTYGSWVTFTDRMLTKDIVPSLVRHVPDVQAAGAPAVTFSQFVQSAPWSIVSLLLAPLAFVASASLSDRNPQSSAPGVLFGLAVVAMLVFLIRDALVLPQTAGSLTYLGAMFIVLLAPTFSAIWAFLGRRGLDPSKPTKSALGLLFAGLSFIPLAWAAEHAGATGAMASVWWLVLAYFVLEVGEMCLAPVGLSAVTQLSVRSVVSLMMGTWFLATAFSETLAALFGKLASLDIPEGTTINMAEAGAKYAHLFWLMMWIGVGCAVVAFLISPLLRKWMHGVR